MFHQPIWQKIFMWHSCGLLTILISTAPVVAAEFIPIGFPPGESASFAEGISPDGSFVVGWGDRSQAKSFRWSQSGMILLPDLPGSTSSGAYDISTYGATVVGTAIFPAPLGDTSREAYRWVESEGIEGLGFLPGFEYRSGAGGVSSDGSVVVGSSSALGGRQRAFRWTEANGMADLGVLQPGESSSARALSADGSVVVGMSFTETTGRGFRWSQAIGMQALDSLPGNDDSFATAISADGSTIVGRSYPEAARWSDTVGVQGLGILPGHERSYAVDTSGDGSAIVGMSGPTVTGDDELFLWTEPEGMRRVTDVLLDSGIDLTGWTLELVSAISDDGNSIVGWGVNPDGIEEGWLARLGSTINPDFNSDGLIDCLDVDSLVVEIVAGTHGSSFDLTGDGLVNLDDLDQWRVLGGAANLPSGNAYLVGDATLDGSVDGLDFIAWNDNKFTSVAAWCLGDFNADGTVNAQDFALWNDNKFMSSAGVSAVPEPGTGVFFIAALMGLAVARRR